MERQGLLNQFHISTVQHYALSLLNELDKIDKRKAHEWELRRALVASGGFDAYGIFAEDGLTRSTTDEAVEDDDLLPDPSGDETISYDFSNAEYDPNKVAEEVREMLARAKIDQASFGDAENYLP